jgi:hypothetical protein
MPSPDQVLLANFQATRFPDLTVDLKLTTANPSRADCVLHILSKWQNTNGGTLNVMGRSSDPNDIPFLIKQVLAPPSIDFHVKSHGQLRHVPFVAWDPIPRTDLRFADQVLVPPGTYAAAVAPAGTVPKGPGAAPTAPCWVVDLQFPAAATQGPTLVRMWIDQANAVDRRVEQHSGATLQRVIVSDGWAQAGPLWGATTRTFFDAQSGGSTTLTVNAPPDPTPLPAATFDHGNFFGGLW